MSSKIEWGVIVLGCFVGALVVIPLNRWLFPTPAQPNKTEYKRGYSHGYEQGKIDVLKELASKALRQEVKEQTWLKQGRLPEIKFEVNK